MNTWQYKPNSLTGESAVIEIEPEQAKTPTEKTEQVSNDGIAKPLTDALHIPRSEYRSIIRQTIDECATAWHPCCGDPDPDGTLQTALGTNMHQIRFEQSITEVEARRLVALECGEFKNLYLESAKAYIAAGSRQIAGLSVSMKEEVKRMVESFESYGNGGLLARVLAVNDAAARGFISICEGVGGGSGE